MLACVALPDEVLGILHGCGPVKPSPESFGDKRSTAAVVAADAFVDIKQYIPSILGCNAPLEDARYAPLEDFTIDDFVGLGAASDLS
jgi:hypothetical protein